MIVLVFILIVNCILVYIIALTIFQYM